MNWTQIRRVAMPALFIAVLLTIIFLGVGEGPATDFVKSSPLGLAGAGFALLVADIFVPVPSSVVILYLGQTIGTVGAILVGAAGLSVGCALGYLAGRLVPQRMLRFSGGGQSTSDMPSGHVVSVLSALRPVPILGETSVISAGVLRLPPVRVLGATTAANLALATAYVLLGSWAEETVGFIAAILLAWTVPMLPFLIGSIVRRISGRRAPTASPR